MKINLAIFGTKNLNNSLEEVKEDLGFSFIYFDPDNFNESILSSVSAVVIDNNICEDKTSLSIVNKITDKPILLLGDQNFTTKCNYDDKISLIAEANLFLMPSRVEKKSVEGFGISFIEAASYGVGSIGGKDGGASDAIVHKKTGLLCDGNDLSSIHDSVISFFNNNNFKKYGINAVKFSENFHWNKIVKQYLKLIN